MGAGFQTLVLQLAQRELCLLSLPSPPFPSVRIGLAGSGCGDPGRRRRHLVGNGETHRRLTDELVDQSRRSWCLGCSLKLEMFPRGLYAAGFVPSLEHLGGHGSF